MALGDLKAISTPCNLSRHVYLSHIMYMHTCACICILRYDTSAGHNMVTLQNHSFTELGKAKQSKSSIRFGQVGLRS